MLAALTILKGVGPRVQQRLAKLGLHSVHDLLVHLPLRYQDRGRLWRVADLRGGMEATIEATVLGSETVGGRRRMLLVRVADDSGALGLRFFNFNAGMTRTLRKDVRLRAFGELRAGYSGLEMMHPEFEILRGDAPAPIDSTLTPVYPTTEGLHQLTLRALTTQALACARQAADAGQLDLLPPALRRQHQLLDLATALRTLHRPPPEQRPEALFSAAHPARRRLIFEELLAHNLSLRNLRARVRHHAAHPLRGDGRLLEPMLRQLPFRLTAAQQRVIGELAEDLARDHPMMRLVQGDVGSGKTVVAAAAVLKAVEAGFQAAVMAPTELLAEQHYRSFSHWLKPLGISVVWLASSLKGRARREALESLADGSAALAVGTHALFQEQVKFHALALVVIDEQHRFGVHQRYALRQKGSQQEHLAHQLIMTATPIPRTLAMTAYADLDHSVIDELPPGRLPVTTVVTSERRRAEVVERVSNACRGGRQAYWVCTLIDESELLQCQAAGDTARVLAEELPDLRVGLVHGRLRAADKEAVMAAFACGEIDLLVATTVIEVGVDVTNASLMIIENAERLGLAQLHQLRGRVGRGATASFCVLMYKGPLSDNARARLEVVRETTDGFEIARRDLEIRGPGEVLGTRQTGMLNLRVADLLRDRELVPEVQRAAIELLAHDSELAAGLVERWIGKEREYGEV